MRLKIKKWDPSNIKQHRIILLVGRRGSGKSTLMEDILYTTSKNYDLAIAMSPTEESLAMFRKHIPPACVYDSFSLQKIEEIVAMQKELCRSGKHRSVLICLDDCMYDKKIMKSTCIREIHYNGRHLKITFLTAVQYLVDIPCELRTQCDYVLSLKENILTNKQKLHKYYFGIFDTFNEFSRTLEVVTNNYGAIVLDNTSATNDIEKVVYWYRGSLSIPPFRIGSSTFWRLSQKFQLKQGERAPFAPTRLQERASSSSTLSSGVGQKDQIILC